MPPFALILPAAGRSVRYGGGRNKLLETLAGELVLRRSFRAFAERPDVAAVIVATADREAIRSALGIPAAARGAMPVIYCDGGPSAPTASGTR